MELAAVIGDEAPSNDVANQARCDDARAKLVAHLGGAADEGLFLAHAPPLAGEEPQPHLVGVPGQLLPRGGEVAEPVLKDGSSGDLEEDLLRHSQPVPRHDARSRVEAESRLQPVARCRHDDVVRDGHVIPAEPRRPSVELDG